MRQATYKKAELIALKARGAQYLSVQKHELNGIAAGTVLGWHKSYDAAWKRAGSSDFTTVEDISNSISDANE